MKIFPQPSLVILILLMLSGASTSSAFEDRRHFSASYRTLHPYRIYLPSDYSEIAGPYPVIYYGHGWGGAHDEIDTPSRWPTVSNQDIQDLSDEGEVIIVFWNGRMRDNHPYNIGDPYQDFINYDSPPGINFHVAYQTQYKDYVRELIEHIDGTFNTRKDREGRILFGHSMGGFMSGFISGKFPQLFNASFMSAPSPRWFVGYPGKAVLYPEGPGFINHRGLHLRLHNTSDGELRFLNHETRDYAQRMDDLDFTYAVYEGGHGAAISLPALRDAFEWAMQCLEKPLPDPERWDHADLYKSFEAWGYAVESNLNDEELEQSGYLVLEGVTKGGLGVRTRQWLPDGVSVRGVEAQILTDAVYEPQTEYTLLDYNQTLDASTKTTVTSDGDGRIQVQVNHDVHNIGIFKEGDAAEIVEVGYKVNGGSRFLPQAKTGALEIRVLNRGGTAAEGVQVRLSTNNPDITLLHSIVDLGSIGSGETAWIPESFEVVANVMTPQKREPLSIRFNLSFTDADENHWVDELDIPVYYEVPPFSQVLVDDGLGYENTMRVLPDSKPRGHGNGNGIAEPGETVMLYVRDSEGSWRTRVFFEENTYVQERFFEDINRLPGTWIDGHTHTSLLEISEDAPDGFTLELLAMYESNDVTMGAMPFVKVRNWGTISLEISGPKRTPLDSLDEDANHIIENLAGFGYIYFNTWPFVFIEYAGWVYVWPDGATADGLHLFVYADSSWRWTNTAWDGWNYNFATNAWTNFQTENSILERRLA